LAHAARWQKPGARRKRLSAVVGVCDGAAMVSSVVVAVAVIVAADAAPGLPGFDPRLEKIVVDAGTSALPKTTQARGVFVVDDHAVVLRDPAPWGDTSLLFDGAGIKDGVVRARVEVGDVLDNAVVVRAAADAPDAEIDGGYGVSLEKNKVRLVRWEHRMARFLGAEQKLDPAPRPGDVIEVVVTVVGPWLQAGVYDGDSFARLAEVAAVDRGFSAGVVGWRVGKYDRGSALRWLSVGDVGGAVAGDGHAVDLGDDGEVAGAGVERLVSVNEADVARLPPDLQKQITEREGGLAVLVTDPTGVERLRRRGITLVKHKTQMPWRHLDAILRGRLGKPPTKTSRGFRVDESYKDDAMVNDLIAAYAARFPAIARAVEVGRSTEGRPIMALVISKDVGVDEAEPAVLFDGAHHGGELMAIEMVLDAMSQLTERYGKDKEVTRFVDGAVIWCVPLVNVDGNHRYIWETRDYDRKNGRDVDANGRVDGWDGVDLYRNYPVGWGGLGEIGSRSWPFHYRWRGPAGGSEPEIQAMMGLVKAQRFVASIDYHTNATKILVPYTDPSMTNPEPNEAWVIADEIAARLPVQVNRRSYQVARNLYPVDGTAQDYFRSAFGTVALLVEGPQNNPLPYDRARNRNVLPGRGIWQGLLRRVVSGPGVRGRVVDEHGAAVEAEVVVVEQAPKQGERWTSRPRDGFYARLVPAPGHYTVVVKAPGKADVTRAVDIGDGPVHLDVTVR
jgi:hypothetical protein